jgi:hypothetical protein
MILCKILRMPHRSLSPTSSQAQDQGDISFVALMLGTTFLKMGGILKKVSEKVNIIFIIIKLMH